MLTDTANRIFEESIADYHRTDDVDRPIANPYPKDGIEHLLYLKNWIDTVQWHLEDIIRNPDIDPAEALVIKRRIDASNQERTDVVEYIDSYFLDKYKTVSPKTEATINTESPAWAIDRLSILALKIYHMERETLRQDVEETHRNACRKKTRRPARTAERPFGSHRRAAGGYRTGKQIHEGVPADENVQRSFA